MTAPTRTPVGQAARFLDTPPQAEDPTQRNWIARGTNFVVVVSEVQAGARLGRVDQPDEYMLLLPDAAATVRAGTEQIDAAPDTLTIVPPGPSEVLMRQAGRVVRVFSDRCADLLPLASNAAAHAEGRSAAVAPLVPWPDPVGGFRLRHYRLSDHLSEGSNMRIFRSCNLMLNVMTPRHGARDIRKLSPHSHDDFEQGSLALQGQWVHHLRTPWTADMGTWRDDEHVEIGSPSLLVVPPKVVHTSRNVGEGTAWLVDIFAPPRVDFSRKGMVANAAEYPMPAEPAP
jgi:mannose-6-phosphate isomerase-like protein (cupin superfamily)